MPLPFFYTEPIHATENTVVLNEENSKHIVQVLRMQAGKQLQLTDGFGNVFLAEITDAHKKKCTVKVIERTKHNSPAYKVCIAVSPVKNNSRLEWFLEKATEMGVSEIVLLMCERTEKQHIRMDRLKGILISAMLQSQQAWLPILEEPKKYNEFIKNVASARKYIAHCEEVKKSSLKALTTNSVISEQAASPIGTANEKLHATVLIGPEGDFTHQEISLALEHGFAPVALGVTRLRTETAALVATTLLCVQ